MKYSFQTKAGDFDWQKLEKVGKGMLWAALSAALVYAAQYLSGTEFGWASPLVMALIAFLVNAARQWSKEYDEANFQPLPHYYASETDAILELARRMDRPEREDLQRELKRLDEPEGKS